MKKNAIYFFNSDEEKIENVKKNVERTIHDLNEISIKDTLKYVAKKILNKIERSI